MNQDTYHLFIAYVGAGILAVALVLDIYHNINVYNWIGIGCLISFFCIYEVKKKMSKVVVINE